MKILLPITFFLAATLSAYAQNDGMSYQAVIIDPNSKELPGVDAQGNILPNALVSIRFTILDASNIEEYQEVQTTTTDQYGMVNLIIGQGEPTSVGTDDFTLISWDGTSKSLRVEIDFEGTGNNFTDMNRQELTLIPYAYHRDITATGTLTVDDATDLNGELTVQGPTNLNSSLDVNNDNATNLSGTLTVAAATSLNDQLTVGGKTNLNDSLNINNQSPTHFSGNITVAAEGTATFDGPTAFNAPAEFVEMTVNGPSTLKGQVTIKPVLENKDAAAAISPLFDDFTNQNDYSKYPLMIEGSHQGIAIKVKDGRGRQNNYISFWDDSDTVGVPKMWGRIEGQNNFDLWTDHEFQTEVALRTTDVIINGIEALIAIFESAQSVVKLTAAATSSTACVGLGACITTPIPSLIVESSSNSILKFANAVVIGGNLILAIAEEGSFIAFKELNIGVSYQSGAGDYAEWLPKQNPLETFIEGELVGIKNGFVTKNTWGVEKIMIVSTRPIVLGNMPQKNDEKNNVKIAFMGQVPVRVIGKVVPGDFILPSDLGSGFAKAVHPKDMKTRDYKKVAGVAWSIIKELTEGLSIVNVAVGINTNDLSDVVAKQEEELIALRAVYDQLEKQMTESNSSLASLVPGYAKAMGLTETNIIIKESSNNEEQQLVHEAYEISKHDENDIVYFELSDEQIDAAIEMAREQYTDMLNNKEQMYKLLFNGSNEIEAIKKGLESKSKRTGKSLEDMIFVPIEENPFWQRMDSDPSYKEEIKAFMRTQVKKEIHTHKKYARKFTDLKLSKD